MTFHEWLVTATTEQFAEFYAKALLFIIILLLLYYVGGAILSALGDQISSRIKRKSSTAANDEVSDQETDLVGLRYITAKIHSRQVKESLKDIIVSVEKLRMYRGYNKLENVPQRLSNLETILLPKIKDTAIRFDMIESDCSDDQISKTAEKLTELAKSVREVLEQEVALLSDDIDTDITTMVTHAAM